MDILLPNLFLVCYGISYNMYYIYLLKEMSLKPLNEILPMNSMATNLVTLKLKLLETIIINYTGE